MTSEAAVLVDFVRALETYANPPVRHTYRHVGATLADSVLQAGLNYNTVVEPRVRRIKTCFPEAETTTGTCELVDCIGVRDFLNWRHPVKPLRFLGLLALFKNECVENESEMKAWLQIESNCRLLARLDGIGPKTIDYLQLLVGINTVAVDRHIRNFVNAAGLALESYDEIKSVIVEAADMLSVTTSSLDAVIWTYVSSQTDDFI